MNSFHQHFHFRCSFLIRSDASRSGKQISDTIVLPPQENKMILARPKSHQSITSRRATKRLCLAAGNVRMILLAALLLFGLVEFAIAQDIFGRIVGTVTDSSGAVVPYVKLTVVNEATQTSRDGTPDRNGYFVADELPVGIYT